MSGDDQRSVMMTDTLSSNSPESPSPGCDFNLGKFSNNTLQKKKRKTIETKVKQVGVFPLHKEVMRATLNN